MPPISKKKTARIALAGKPKPIAKAMKQDKSADAKMTPAMIKKDIAADKKNLAKKTAKKK